MTDDKPPPPPPPVWTRGMGDQRLEGLTGRARLMEIIRLALEVVTKDEDDLSL